MVASSSSSRTATTTATLAKSSSSADFLANAYGTAEQRRTRKRISPVQLVCLEALYREESHPTRDQRDALAKRIQMETKSVTIWFQNKRQTDRKVLLHNATNARNIARSSSAPDITLTTSTDQPREHSDPLRKQSIGRAVSLSSNLFTRTSSFSSASSTSTTSSTSSTSSTSRPRPSLDRVASRSEIRFTEKSATLGLGLARTHSDGSLSLVHEREKNTSFVRSHSATLTRAPESPPPNVPKPLWSTMLSSPLAPSSPPPADIVAYTRTRKARTLDWACAAARVTDESPLNLKRNPYPLAHPFSREELEREYEEATAMTEDEAELVTPTGSQDIPQSWEEDGSAAPTMQRTRCQTSEAMQAMGLMQDMDSAMSGILHDSESMDAASVGGWEEDEMHAALALCGLRG